MLASLTEPARAVIDPVEGVPKSVAQRRWFWPLLFLVAASCFSGVAVGLRLDMLPKVLAKAGPTVSEQDLAQKVTAAHHIAIVGGVAMGLFAVPIIVLLLALGVKFASWLIGRKVPYKQLFAIVALALVPVAIERVVFGVAALAQYQISFMQLGRVIPSSLGAILHVHNPHIGKLLGAVDFFDLWSVVLLGLGYASATGMKKWRALIFAFVLYACFVGVFVLGLPGMAGGHR